MPVNNDMTIEETIENLDKTAKNQFECADKIDELHCDSTSTRNMASYHRQLAEWLKKLQAYEKIISELSEAMQWYDGCEKCQGFREYPTSDFLDDVRSWVKQFEEVNADGKTEDT